MPVDYTKLRNLTARDIIAALFKDSFSLRHQKGSHQRYHHLDGRRVTVTFHKASGTFPLGTLRSMIERQARWNEDDLKRLGLLK